MPANSDDFETALLPSRPTEVAFASGLVFASPSSTRRRMASDRDGVSACLTAQLSMRALSSSGRRIDLAGICPVAGRPGFRFFDAFIVFVVQ